jgi:carboxyl-terminal processing protease
MMNSKRSLLSFFLILLILVGVFFGTIGANSNDIYSAISKNLPVLGLIYKEISANYVDEIDTEKFLKAGIDGMLNTLDPYTVYIEKEDGHQLQVLTQSKYDGVGIPINLRNNVVTVVEPPFLGTPAARVGVREGDIIIEVDGESTQKLGLNKTAQKIRGPIGTEVTLKIRREGVPKPLEFTIVREQIKIEDVRYAGIIQDGIGYIRLTRFSRNSSFEVAEAVQRLKQEDLNGLILDLRSNPGGMLEAAVEISDLFLPKDVVIVSTKGRTDRSMRVEKASHIPLYGDGSLVILVNRFSASASEIVAGAIQDHDRGIVVGDTTFGKGLVQSVIPMSPNAVLKITTAKYYTPSGRCIQKRKYSSWSDSTFTDNSSAYYTRLGRLVTGGGGIAPDVTITQTRLNDYVVDMRRKSLFFNFAVQYVNTHTPGDSSVHIDEDILNDFRRYIKEKSFEYHHPIENMLEDLKTASLDEGYSASLVQDIDQLQRSLDLIKEEMFQKNQNDIRAFLRRELASKLFGIRREVEVGLQDDPVVKKAIEILSDKELYTSMLKK